MISYWKKGKGSFLRILRRYEFVALFRKPFDFTDFELMFVGLRTNLLEIGAVSLSRQLFIEIHVLCNRSLDRDSATSSFVLI